MLSLSFSLSFWYFDLSGEMVLALVEVISIQQQLWTHFCYHLLLLLLHYLQRGAAIFLI